MNRNAEASKVLRLLQKKSEEIVMYSFCKYWDRERRNNINQALSRLNEIYKVRGDKGKLINHIRPIIKQSLINMYKGAYEDKSPGRYSYAPDLSAEKELLKLDHAITEKVEEWLK